MALSRLPAWLLTSAIGVGYGRSVSARCRWLGQTASMGMPDIAALRAERPDVEQKLAELEALGRQRLAAMGDSGHCYGALIAHEGAEALARTRPGETVKQCSRGNECRGLKVAHPISNASCRQVLAPCPWCDTPTS